MITKDRLVEPSDPYMSIHHADLKRGSLTHPQKPGIRKLEDDDRHCLRKDSLTTPGRGQKLKLEGLWWGLDKGVGRLAGPLFRWGKEAAQPGTGEVLQPGMGLEGRLG